MSVLGALDKGDPAAVNSEANARDLSLDLGPDFNPSSSVDFGNSVDLGNVIPFAPRSTTTVAMFDLGIATDSCDEEDTLGHRS